VLDLALLQALIHASLDLLAESIHLISLLLNESGLSGDNLLMALLHVAIALLLFHLLSFDLYLVSLGILLLTRKLTLDGLEVEKLGRELESEGKSLLKVLSVFLEVADVTLLKGTNGSLILLFNLRKCLIPTLVEILILHQVSLLNLLSFAGLIVHKLLTTTVVILNLELLNTVLSHLCLNVLALHLALLAVLLQDGTINRKRISLKHFSSENRKSFHSPSNIHF